VAGVASVRKELKEIVRAAEEQGWWVDRTSKGHLLFYAPDGENIVTTGGTPSDHRALANLISRLRRHGFVWKGR
jgi:predicted RNA binding protein YcfA (HicA-like mRNA interferase family)